MSARERDLAWEALVETTHANPAIERGQLNTALRAIREASLTEGLAEESLPEEIRLRGRAYQAVFSGCALTPMALAKHWFRVLAQPIQSSPVEQALERLRQR